MSLAPPTPPQITFTRADLVLPKDVKWLWYPYIPAGMLTLLEGDPGLGKSWITCAIAADLSAGRKLPGQAHALPPQKVIMLSQEDALEETIRPRLDAQGAVLENIYLSGSFFTLNTRTLDRLEDYMLNSVATVLFLDPLVAYMGGKLDMNKANEIRALMGPLNQLAQRTGCAIIPVRHLRKSGGDNAKYRGIGSIDLTGVVRSVLQVGEDKSGVKYMAHIKHNLSVPGGTLFYTMDEGKLQWTGEAEAGWAPIKLNSRPKALNRAVILINDALKEGPQPVARIFELGRAEKITESTLNRAKRGLAHSYKDGDVWFWELDKHTDPASAITVKTPKLNGAGKVQPTVQVGPEVDPAVLADALARLGRG